MAVQKRLLIMRGLPGSGKSTRARQLAGKFILEGGTSVAILSTDDFFMVDGEYRHDPDRLSEAHDWNYQRTILMMNGGVELVIVDNTNIVRSRFANYVALTRRYPDYLVEEVNMHQNGITEGDIDWCANNNSHGVPASSIREMADAWEK